MDRSSLNAKAALVLNDRALEHEKALAQLQCLDQEAFNQPDSSDFFQSLDQLRRMQIDLALEHLSLETVSSDTQISSDGANDEDETSARYRRNAERFVKKEKDVNNLMERKRSVKPCENFMMLLLTSDREHVVSTTVRRIGRRYLRQT
ncbi:hypothetical protein BC832DRAFT_277216 [Gaertneriomyces semiglobifer]|nr:hypothetical protein BC832DRAFT_277216 [Gaertneriomyces semiglobifer]